MVRSRVVSNVRPFISCVYKAPRVPGRSCLLGIPVRYSAGEQVIDSYCQVHPKASLGLATVDYKCTAHQRKKGRFSAERVVSLWKRDVVRSSAANRTKWTISTSFRTQGFGQESEKH